MKALRLAAIAVAVLFSSCGEVQRSADEDAANAVSTSDGETCIARHGGQDGGRTVRGIYVGMSLRTAKELLSCHDERFVFADVPFDDGVRQAIGSLPYGEGWLGEARTQGGEGELAPGEERVFLAAIGGATEFKVVGVWREEALNADAAVSVSDAVALLIAKYGEPSREQTRRVNRSGGVVIGEYGGISGLSRAEGTRGLVWLYQDGRLMPSTASARLQQCDEGMSIDPLQNGRMGGTCELMIKAQVVPDSSDPNRAARIQVGLFNRQFARILIAVDRQARETEARQAQAERASRIRSQENAPDL